MKTLIVTVLLFAAASASFISFKDAAKPLVDQTVADFVRHMQVNAKPLHSVLKTKRSLQVARLERQIQTDLGQALQEQLNNVLAQIQDAIDHGQLVAQSLIDKAKELLAQLQEGGANILSLATTFLQMLLESGQNFLGNILGGLIGKRDIISDLLDTLLGALNLDNLLQSLLDTLFGGLGKQRDIITDLLMSLLGSVLDAIDLSSIPIIGDLLGLLGKRDAVKDPRIWNTILDTLGSIWNGISDTFSDFKDWVQQMASEGLNTLQGHFANIQELASLFLGHFTEMTMATIDEAVEFFRPYHNDLGELWQQILDAANQAHQTITG